MELRWFVFVILLMFHAKESQCGSSSYSSEMQTSFSIWVSSLEPTVDQDIVLRPGLPVIVASPSMPASNSAAASSSEASDDPFNSLGPKPCNFSGGSWKFPIAGLYSNFQKAYSQYSRTKPVVNETIRDDLIRAVIFINNATANGSNPDILLAEIRAFVSHLFSFSENAENYEIDTEDPRITCENVDDRIQLVHDIGELTAIEGEDFNVTIDALAFFLERLSNETYGENVENLKTLLGRIVEHSTVLSSENDAVLVSVETLLDGLASFRDRKCGDQSTTVGGSVNEDSRIEATTEKSSS